jgi:DNA (cytosine-5)-methyltransferase 3A
MTNIKPITVLSLFDGMSCGMIALERAGIPVKAYYASEVDKWAIKVSKHNYPHIIQIGDVTKVTYKEGTLYTENREHCVGDIDLVIAGSPCQGFSFAGKQLAFDDPRSSLYFEFERILKEVSPKWWLLENVYMKKEHENVISERLGVQAIKINSNLVSAQNRRRNYWTNIKGVSQPSDKGIKLIDILERNVDSRFTLSESARAYVTKPERLAKKFTSLSPEKAQCLMSGYEKLNGTFVVTANGDFSDAGDSTTKTGTLTARYFKGVENFGSSPFIVDSKYVLSEKATDRALNNPRSRAVYPHTEKTGALLANQAKYSTDMISLILDNATVRKMTPVECERLQTVPDNYTGVVADTHRYEMLGNGWTIDVISHILGNILVDDK